MENPLFPGESPPAVKFFASMVMVPPFGMACTAFMMMLFITWLIWPSSISAGQSPACML